MTALDKQARLAGLLYVLMSLVAPLRLIYIPTTLFVSGNAGATVANIATHETLFRWAIFGDLFVGIMLIFVLLALYRLLKPTGHTLAMVMLILGGILPSTIYILNTVNDAAALLLIRGAPFLDAFDKPQRDALAVLFLRLHGEVVVSAQTLWGAWLVPLAILVYRCGFLPRILAAWLMLNAAAYIAQSFTGIVLPQYLDSLEPICFPIQMGEVAFMLWLLIVGARRYPFTRKTSA